MSSEAVRVLLVEDDRYVRAGLARALSESGRVLVAAEAATVAASIEAIRSEVAIDVALVDLALPDGSGIDVIRALRRERVEVAALALTVLADPATIDAAILAGASGYILKEMTSGALVDAVVQAAQGGAPLSPSVASAILATYRERGGPGSSANPGFDDADLTPRELDVLRLLCDGNTYVNVAAALGIGVGTVQSHVKSIYAKMGVASKTELASAARRRRII